MRIHDTPPRRNRIEPLLPMIDVVFFLVVFFMIVSRLADPEPFPVASPETASAEETRGDFGLYLSETGELGFVGPEGTVLGEAVLPALVAAKEAFCRTEDCTAVPPVVVLHADAKAPADRLAGLIPALSQAGFARVSLLTVTR